jgi:hypothetical protein
MRKLVKFDRVVRIMVPIWHQKEFLSSSKNQTIYRRPMSILELGPGKEYKCEDLQGLLNRGAVIAKEDYTYVCSCGFIPVLRDEPTLPNALTTGLDPVEDLN